MAMPAAIITYSKATQTEVSLHELQEREAEHESGKVKLDEMTRLSDEQKSQIVGNQKTIDQHKCHIAKCIDVVKKLLKEKSSIEKKEARQKCMQNRLRLGQFVTQRVGATFQVRIKKIWYYYICWWHNGGGYCASPIESNC